METLSQPPTEDAFVQNPYAFYERARQQAGIMFFWEDYGLPCALSHAANWAILRDRRFGRQPPPGQEPDKPPHQRCFWAVEEHSMLELEPPRHTRLRALVLRAFTSRRIAALEPMIATLAHQLIDRLSGRRFDLIEEFAQPLAVTVITRLLGVPEERGEELLDWSHAMVGMYQARRDHEMEVAAARAAAEFSAFIGEYVDYRRNRPAQDLITQLIAAEQDGDRLSREELITTCILLLNAGHEATVHSFGNAVKALLESGSGPEVLAPDRIEATVEETLRFDPPLHMFQRWAYEDVEVGRHVIRKGQKVACLLAAANRDPARWDRPGIFDPSRPVQTNLAFGAGVHFCIGAPLARLELQCALPILFSRLPGLEIAQPPRYAPSYHFHGLEALWLRG